MANEELSVTQAALQLGVTRQRVHQLVQSGALEAHKIGSSWAVDAASVAARLERAVRPGRPAAKAPDKQCYTLMNAEYEVLDFAYDRANRHFSASHDIHDASRAPVGVVSGSGKYASASALYDWWRHRTVPAEREGIDSKLVELGVESPEEIPFASLGLSLSDQYWIRPESARDLRWEDVNFFDNSFKSESKGWLDAVGGQRTPDNTSEGQLSKRWVCRGARRFLLKGGDGYAQVPYNEKAATLLFRRLLSKGDFVSYKVEERDGVPVSVCENFISRREEYIPAWHLRPHGKKADGRHALNTYLETCELLGVENIEEFLSKMLVCDFIIANEDRHWRNFGLVRNIDTLEYRVAPLFDAGNSLWYSKSLQTLRAKNFAFESKPFNRNSVKQLLMTPDIDWFDPSRLDGFPEEAESVFRKDEEIAQRASFIAEGIARNTEQVCTRLL